MIEDMSKQPVTNKPTLTVIKGGNEREMRLIRALDKAAGFKDDPEADAALIRAAERYEQESLAAQQASREALTVIK